MDRFSFEADPAAHWPRYHGSGKRPNGSTRPILILIDMALAELGNGIKSQSSPELGEESRGDGIAQQL